MDDAFIGSEALRDGVVANKYQLRKRFRALYPDVYLPMGATPTLAQRTAAAWLWTRRQGVIAGSAASAMHGARWIPDDAPVEVIWTNRPCASGYSHSPGPVVAREELHRWRA